MIDQLVRDVKAVPLCVLEEIPVGLGRAFNVGPLRLAVFRSRSGKVFAVENSCPHRNGPLADGMMVGDQVVCPLHAFRFDLGSGHCDQPGVCAVSTYPLEIRDGVIYLESVDG